MLAAPLCVCLRTYSILGAAQIDDACKHRYVSVDEDAGSRLQLLHACFIPIRYASQACPAVERREGLHSPRVKCWIGAIIAQRDTHQRATHQVHFTSLRYPVSNLRC